MKTEIKKNKGIIKIIIAFAGITVSCLAYGQEAITMGINDIKASSEAINRAVTFGEDVYLGRREGDGFLRIEGMNFKEGIIEADIKGSNTPQQSFVGIAFHGTDDDNYDAIYFRPFNFQNPKRKSNSVQYIAHPTFTWDKLRTDSPGNYESEVNADLDPDDWFHVRIHIRQSRVDVYVNDKDKPTLSVNKLSSTEAGWIGFWTGNFSDGWFRNLKVIPLII